MVRTVLMLACCFIGPSTLPAADEPAAPVTSGKVSGRVLDAESMAPIADVEVRLLKDSPGGRTFPLKPSKSRSRADGTFEFSRLAPGAYRVYAFHGNKASRTRLAEFDKAVVNKDGTSESVSLQMKEGLQLKVRVLAEATNQPIANASVRLRWTDLDDNSATDSKGEVLISCLIPGDQYVEAKADDYQLVNTNQTLQDKLTEVVLKLPPGGSVRGTALDTSGTALAGVDVYVSSAKGSGLGFDHAVSDPAGKFVLNNVPLSEALRIHASKKDFEGYSNNEFSLNGEPYRPLTIQLKPRPSGGDVEIMVVDREGRPIPEASVSNYSGSSSEMLRMTTGKDGKGSLKRLYLQYGHKGAVLFVRAEGFGPQQVELPLPMDGETASTKIVLERGHRFQGRIVSSNGKPVKSATIYFNDGNINSQNGTLGGQLKPDSEGRFSSSSLEAGTTLNISAPGHSPRDHVEIPLDLDVEMPIVLEPVGQLRGRVTVANTEEPVLKFNVKLRTAAVTPPGAKAANGYPSSWSETGKTISDRDGKFVWPDLPNGVAYDATISADGYEPRRVPGWIAAPSSEIETKVELQPIDPKHTAEFGGRILDQKGDPLEGVVVHLIGIDPEAFPPGYPWAEVPFHLIKSDQANLQPMCQFDHQTVTTADGGFKFPRVSTRWRCELVYWSDSVPTTRLTGRNKLKPEQQGFQEILAPTGVTIIGEIDPKAFPEVGYVTAALQGEFSFDSRQQQFKEGQPATSFVLRGLPAGEISISLMSKPTVRRENGSTSYLHTTLSSRVVNGKGGESVKVRFE